MPSNWLPVVRDEEYLKILTNILHKNNLYVLNSILSNKILNLHIMYILIQI